MLTLQHIPANKKYLLAISGGIDSMVMLDLFVKNKIACAVAHCNFNLRAAESDGDEQLVRRICAENNITCYVQAMETEKYVAEHKVSIQVAARTLRYAYFEQLCQEHHFDFIATAHHTNDNIETVLFHFCRGTGIQGLTGIQAINHNIIRPLLDIQKKDIQAYAKSHAIAYRDDSSNQKQDYTRNKLRLNIIPQLEEIFPSFEQNMLANIERLQEANMLYAQAIEKHRQKLIELRGKDFYIPILKLKAVKPMHTILYELLKPFGFSFEQSQQVVLLMDSQTGAYVENENHRVYKNRNVLIITSRQTTLSDRVVIESPNTKLSFADGEMTLQLINPSGIQLLTELHIANINADLLEFPLVLRPWKTGDYLYPFGMLKKKKVSRVLIDMKISQPQKEKTWVLESNQKIVWIVGLKMDNRYRVTDKTKSILQCVLGK